MQVGASGETLVVKSPEDTVLTKAPLVPAGAGVFPSASGAMSSK